MIIGIVGKPNVGKTSLFNALTMQNAQVADYPFTTIEPNEGIAYVRVEEPSVKFGIKANPKKGFILDSYRFVPVKVIDVAGLVPGAHLGRGLGNKFLDNLRQADCLIHVIDISGSVDAEGRVVGVDKYDPSLDIEWLENEIDKWFEGIVKKNWEKIRRDILYAKKDRVLTVLKYLGGLNIRKEHIEEVLEKIGKNPEEFNDEDIEIFSREIRKISKPMMVAANKIDIGISEKNFKKLKEKFPEKIIVPCSALAEYFLKKLWNEGKIEYIPGTDKIKIIGNLSEKEKKILEYIENKIIRKWGSTGVQQVIESAVFDLLNYIAVFPVATSKMTDNEGNVLPECFLVKKGTKAIDLAYMIHTEIGEKFVKAFVINKERYFGKDYVLENGDIVQILFSK